MESELSRLENWNNLLAAEVINYCKSLVLGKDNDRYILATAQKSHRVILAWGNHGTWQKQDLLVLQLLKNSAHLFTA